MNVFDDGFNESLQDDGLRSMIEEKDRLIELQEKDIDCLKQEIRQLKTQIDCFQSEKK